ncbi:MAG: hypothetical protein ACKOVH_04630 [Actinomycetota bacterium]
MGAQKSATRWLRVNLGLHPEIFVAGRELHFWNSPAKVRSAEGIDRYRQQFAGWLGEPFVGESTPGYMIWRHRPWRTARLIQQGIPEARLIALLRNPIDRAQSALRHHIRRKRIPPGAVLAEVLRERQPARFDRLCLVSGGWYAASLRPFHELFGDQLMVVLHDDIVATPVGVYEEVVAHIGAGVGFVPATIDRVVFGAGTGDDQRHVLTPEDRAKIWGFFRDDVARLEELIGRDLSGWDPTV